MVTMVNVEAVPHPFSLSLEGDVVCLRFQSFGSKATGLVRGFCGFRDAEIDTTRPKGRKPLRCLRRREALDPWRLGFFVSRKKTLVQTLISFYSFLACGACSYVYSFLSSKSILDIFTIPKFFYLINSRKIKN